MDGAGLRGLVIEYPAGLLDYIKLIVVRLLFINFIRLLSGVSVKRF